MSNFAHYRIVHLSKYYPPDRGGIESYIQTIARSQSKLGADVQVLCVNSLNPQGVPTERTQTIREMDGGVQVIRVGRLASLMRFDFCPGLLQELYRLTQSPRTIVHVHAPNPTMLVALSALILLKGTVPIVVTHHSDIIKQKKLKYFLRPIEHFVYQKSLLILATTPNYIEGSDLLKGFVDKLNYTPLILELDKYYYPSTQSLSFAQFLRDTFGDTIWLSVGRLVYYKGLHVAIQALTQLPGVLVIIGSGPLEKELKSLAHRLQLTERVIWLGNVTEDELIGAYKAATALLFPSNARSEAFGLVQVEAMASSCPVINTDILFSGVSWVCRHEQEALTVPINDPQSLAEAARRLLAEEGLRQRLAEAGRKRSQDFSYVLHTKRLFKFYDGVLAKLANA